MEYEQIKAGVLEFCEASFVEVFQNQGCLVYRSVEDGVLPASYSRSVVIEAKAPEIELLMSLSIPQTILTATYPSKEEIEELDSDLLVDWCKELANRLMGGVKNRVGATTSPMTLGIPQEHVNDDIFKGFDIEQMVFEAEGGLFGCKLGLRVLGEISSLDQPEVDCMDGELELF